MKVMECQFIVNARPSTTISSSLSRWFLVVAGIQLQIIFINSGIYPRVLPYPLFFDELGSSVHRVSWGLKVAEVALKDTPYLPYTHLPTEPWCNATHSTDELLNTASSFRADFVAIPIVYQLGPLVRGQRVKTRRPGYLVGSKKGDRFAGSTWEFDNDGITFRSCPHHDKSHDNGRTKGMVRHAISFHPTEG